MIGKWRIANFPRYLMCSIQHWVKNILLKKLYMFILLLNKYNKNFTKKVNLCYFLSKVNFNVTRTRTSF